MKKGWQWQDYDKEKYEKWMRHGPPEWKHRGGRLFLRFLFIFGLIVLLVLGGMGILALLFTRVAGGSDEIVPFVWIGGCGLALGLPILAIAIAGRAFRRITMPLADVMTAADAVAEGDFTVRVAEDRRRSEFAQLARSFNRMTEELQRSDRMRRSLTADVAHELRTPLHIIQGNLEGVLDGVYEPTAEHIEATLDETRMLARLVEDLHTLSQAEAGQLSLRMEEVDVTDLLADVETSFSGLAAVKHIDLAVDFAGKAADLTVTGDVDRLDQILSNLVINALRHTPAGGRVSLHAQRENGAVHIIVTDTGQGIAAEELPFIFERFWRGDVSRTHVDGAGAGLGLAIAKQLIEAQQGTIEVASTLDVGTQFTITMPAI
ncbi:MAG: ATP-binding protein [Candidatus Promineifilaceae bacterium]|nr:ATP-binding protein [Candidatus Promineifilaceae bacterium]